MYKQAQREVENLQEQVRQLTERLGYVDPGPSFVHLTGQESRLFNALLHGKVLTKEMCLSALYFDRNGDEPEMKIADVFICKLRKKLLPFGIVVETIWGRGYVMPEASKAKARELDPTKEPIAA